MKKTFFLLTGVLFVLLFLGCPNATETPNVPGDIKKIEMLPVPAGSFQRDGTAENISVITKAYSLSKYQITRQQFLDI